MTNEHKFTYTNKERTEAIYRGLTIALRHTTRLHDQGQMKAIRYSCRQEGFQVVAWTRKELMKKIDKKIIKHIICAV
tara:strand:- start:82 stop:312 length:231 start_codon:yes stop_codon:yes gene_type:complete